MPGIPYHVCDECLAPVVPGRTRCELHLKKAAERVNRWYYAHHKEARRRENARRRAQRVQELAA